MKKIRYIRGAKKERKGGLYSTTHLYINQLVKYY